MVTTKKRRNQIKKWLLQHKVFLNITALEKEHSFPKGSIQKFLKYNRPLNDERIEILDQWITDLIKSYRKS